MLRSALSENNERPIAPLHSSALVSLTSLQLGNTAGVAWNLAKALAAFQCETAVVDLEPEQGNFQSDVKLHMQPGVSAITRAANFGRIVMLARSSDVVHFHFGIRPFARYLRKVCKAPFFVHYHGSDLREGIADAFRSLAVAEFVSTPDLLRWAPDATWVPNPSPLPLPPVRDRGSRPVVGHFPSTPEKKGTTTITKKIHEMQKSIDFEYRLATGVTQKVVIQEMANCDIVIDQLSPYGVYGMAAVEAMGLGCVVLSSIEPKFFDRCPIVSISSETFEARLAEVLLSPESWWMIGEQGRSYVARVHRPAAVAKLVLDEYLKHVTS